MARSTAVSGGSQMVQQSKVQLSSNIIHQIIRPSTDDVNSDASTENVLYSYRMLCTGHTQQHIIANSFLISHDVTKGYTIFQSTKAYRRLVPTSSFFVDFLKIKHQCLTALCCIV